MADTDEELHAFAAAIGLKRRWAQYPGTWKSHYDVTDTKRRQAIARGAVPIGYTSAEAGQLTHRKLTEQRRRERGEYQEPPTSAAVAPVVAEQLSMPIEWSPVEKWRWGR